MRQQADGSFTADLTYADLAARIKLSERQTRRMLAKDAEIDRTYPRLFRHRRREFVVDLGRNHVPLTFAWIGDYRTAADIANEPAAQPPPVIQVELSEQQAAPDEYVSRRLSLIDLLRSQLNPSRTLAIWEQMDVIRRSLRGCGLNQKCRRCLIEQYAERDGFF
jgi:hypothetical protein